MGPQWGPALQGASTHRARARWGWREQPGAFPCAAQAPSSKCACLHLCVCDVFVFLFHVLLLLLSLSLLTPLPSSAIPNFPAPGTHLPARSWRSRSAGPDLFPHSRKVSALPCPSSSLLMAWQPGRQGSYQRKGQVGLSGALLLPTHPQAYQSSSRS